MLEIAELAHIPCVVGPNGPVPVYESDYMIKQAVDIVDNSGAMALRKTLFLSLLAGRTKFFLPLQPSLSA